MYEDSILKIKSGDLTVLDKIYLDCKPKFLYYAQKQFPTILLEEIEDVYQDTVIAFYQNIKSGSLTQINSSLSAYIIQIGKIKLIQYIEKNNKLNKIKEGIHEERLMDEEYNLKIDQCVKFIYSKMSASCKRILHLFYFEKKSMVEIAQILGYKNSDTVKAKKSRCISSFSIQANKMYFNEE
jgi:RNA polymerase sigma-70 factor (ECF subfamily)